MTVSIDVLIGHGYLLGYDEEGKDENFTGVIATKTENERYTLYREIKENSQQNLDNKGEKIRKFILVFSGPEEAYKGRVRK